MIWLCLIPISILLIIFALFSTTIDDKFVFATLSILLPLSVYFYVSYRRMARLEDKFPIFIRDLSLNLQMGASLLQSIRNSIVSSELDEMKEIEKRVSFGESFESSFIKFATKCGNVSIKRAARVVSSALKAGGKIEDVFFFFSP